MFDLPCRHKVYTHKASVEAESPCRLEAAVR